MPHRASARTVTSPSTLQAPLPPQQLETPYDANIHQLRRHWKWATFSQFFFTFSPLLAMSDVTLTDVENDLVHSTNRVLSRIMQRLLVTLTQDRKITADSWQNVLRRQYQRREPQASPIGLPARSQHFITESSRASTAPLGTVSEVLTNEAECEDQSPEQYNQSTVPSADNPDTLARNEGSIENQGHISATKVEEEDETLDESEKQLDWLDLSMLAKLDSLHTLAEWQFQNPNRVRQQMKTDDEQATWRIEPIGYDAKRNAYWLIGGDRLWIQREPPRPNLKRKRKPNGNSRNTAKKHPLSLSTKRQRVDLDLEAVEQSPVARPTRGKAKSQLTPSPRGARAAKLRANQRLDAQARDIADCQVAVSRTSAMLRKPTGIRVSARLRGVVAQDDEWQEVPDEWLATGDTHQKHARAASSGRLPAGKKKIKTGLESEESSISELTELSDGEDDTVGTERGLHEKPMADVDETNAEHSTDDIDDQPIEGAKPVTPPLPVGFIEWETICVTLEEWESIEQQFEKATHYAEKALYKVLSQNIVPTVTAELREIEKKRRMEEAVVHRKRSSRIAMKEVEKEEERAATRKRVEEDEKMSRTRRLEARQQREQAERLKRENAREQRRKERESREQESAETCEAELKPDAPVDIMQKDPSTNLVPLGHSEAPVPMNGTGSGSRSPVENWVLDCEICGGKGVNQDDGVPLLCCGVCGRWQHIVCHDKQDTIAGRPKRNWDAEDFICRQCRPASSTDPSSSPTSLLSFGGNNKRGQASNSQGHYVASSDHTESYHISEYHENSSSNARYPCDQSDVQAIASSPPIQSYSSQTRSAAVTFAHYQPQQGGFSTSRPTHSVQDVQPPQHAPYAVTPHAVSPGTTYPPTVHTVTPSPTPIHEQWHPSSYPRTSNPYPLNGGSSILAQGVHPYYNGHAHTPYSHIRGTNNQTVYAGLRHVPSYQHSK